MDRRTFVCLIASGLLAAPLGAGAQQPRRGRVARIGILSQSRTGAGPEELALALQQFGYGDGRGAVIEWRWADDKSDRFADLADELVRLKVDVIVAMGSEATEAAQQATSTIPIVFAQARRLARAAAHQVRVRGQPQDCQGARPHDPAIVAAARRRGDSVIPHRALIAGSAPVAAVGDRAHSFNGRLN